MIAFGGRREGLTGQVPGVAAGRSNVARLGARGASGRMPLPRAGRPTARAVESVKASAPLQTAARRPLVVVVVVVRTPTPNYLRQASQNLGKYGLWLWVMPHGGGPPLSILPPLARGRDPTPPLPPPPPILPPPPLARHRGSGGVRDSANRIYGREGCLWPNAASQGRPPDGSGG